jgi:hypothetical protein
MAETTVALLTCDICGKPASASVTFRLNGQNRITDLCDSHLQMFTKNSRVPRRGRKVTTTLTDLGLRVQAAPRRGRPSKSTSRAQSPRRRKAVAATS